jgi:hypothetical protein
MATCSYVNNSEYDNKKVAVLHITAAGLILQCNMSVWLHAYSPVRVGPKGVQLLKDTWKLVLVAPRAAIAVLLLAGLAQWVRCVCDRWQGKFRLCAR